MSPPFRGGRCGSLNARGLAWNTLGAVSLAAASVSCGFPAPEACDLACGEQNACPDGFECQTPEQRCVPVGTVAPCPPVRRVGSEQPAPGVGGAGTRGDAGPGGAGTSEAGASGAPGGGGEGPAGGGPGETGGDSGLGGSGGSGAPGDLGIEDSTATTSCTGEAFNRSLRATGGVAPYVWRVLAAPSGVEFSDLAADVLELSGVPTEPGLIELELEDSTGTIAHPDAQLVSESPLVTRPELPAVCSGEPYQVELQAQGGRPDGYVWSVELISADGSGDTLEDLGLALSGATLSGELDAGRAGEAPFHLALTVNDGACSSSRLLDLDVVAPDSDACPRIGLLDAPGVDALPPPCLGNAYVETLTVQGGQPPYHWTALAVPPGLSLSSEDELAPLSGVAQGDGELAVELTDGASRTIRKSYEVRARDKCWLAYVASEPGPARLELVDGRLLDRQPDEARRTLPTSSGDAVVDFEFSPDGRFVAYRLGPDAGALRLELSRLSDGALQALELAGSVVTYAWSPDSALLAVALDAGAQTLLGGVDVSALDRSSVAPGAELGAPRVLAPRAVSSVDSELTWSDAEHLGFLSRGAEGQPRRSLVMLAQGAAGFLPPSTVGALDFSDAAQVVGGAGGLFVAEPETGLHTFLANDARAPLTHASDLVLSPSGAFAGLARAGGLEIFRPSDASAVPEQPFSTADGCTTLLAWASGRDRIACAARRGADDQVALFDVPPAAGAAAPLTLIPEPYAYPAGAHAGRRRLLSASGRWFAFVTDDDLYVARSGQGATHLATDAPTALFGARPSALAFSPDERFLLVGAGNALSLLDLEGAQSLPLGLSASALIEDDCSERFVDGAPGWCGSEARAPQPIWSSGSDLVAFRSSLGTLLVVDASRAPSGVVGAPIAPDGGCSEACGSSVSARFQP